MSTATLTTDRIEIAELFARLANLLDDGRYDDVHTVYHPDVVVHSPLGGQLHGLDEVASYLKRSQVAGEQTLHVHGDVLVHVNGEQAEASANQLVYRYRDGAPPHQTSGVRVACTAVRTSAGWRISQLRITLAWTHEQ
ncbi:nuclear transport factor 2 family protein [Micromonospora sp. DT48]|uniref:nuclear transport factor 2 family protein n=1 Tax=Micromonospora sp. DT48 TaxID=3393429 RepID=UPI003CF0C213